MQAATRIGVPRTWLRAVVLGALLASLYVMLATGTATLTAWTERFVSLSRFPALLAGFYLTWILGRSAVRGVTRRTGLLVGSLTCAAICDPAFLVASVLWIVAFHRVLFSGARHRLAWALAFVIASFVAFAVVCNRDLWPQWLAEHRNISRWGYLFAVSYTFRIAWLLHQVRMQRTEYLSIADLVLYFVFAPFFIIVPYMVAIPRCDRFCDGLSRHDLAIERSGLRMFAWGVLLTLVLAGVRYVHDPQYASVEAVRAGAYGAAFFEGLLYYPVEVVLIACAISSISIGMVRVLGIDLGPSFSAPLFSLSVTEWWRRWNTHFRDLLVDIFYYPIVMRNRRRPMTGIVLGCASVFFVGSFLLHIPKTYFRYGHIDAMPFSLLPESAIMFVLVAGSLVLERRRPVVPPRPTGLGFAIRIVTTWVLIFSAVVLAGYGTADAWSRRHPMTPVIAPTPEGNP